MNAPELLARAIGHLLKVSALIQPKAEPGSAVRLEDAFMWNHANNVAMMGVDCQRLLESGSFSAPALLARTMMESALTLSAAATRADFMREKLDYDLRQNLRRVEQAEKELGTDFTKEKQTLRELLDGVRDGSSHNQNEKLDFLQIAKSAKCDSTAAYRNYYFVLSFHVHADWLAFKQAMAAPGPPIKAVRAAIFSCAVSVESLIDFYPQISNQTDVCENRAIWQALVNGGKAPTL